MNCIHGYSMVKHCEKCAEDAALQAKPYQSTEKVEAIEFAEITQPGAFPETPPLGRDGRAPIDIENSMAVATRELAESIAHLAPAISALAASFNGSKPTEVRDAPIYGPVAEKEIMQFCGFFGWRYDSMAERVREVLTNFAAGRGLL